ncbi:MAG: hypothetical protein ACRBCT_10120, partial [Alphaproteobacteria bacterium]
MMGSFSLELDIAAALGGVLEVWLDGVQVDNAVITASSGTDTQSTQFIIEHGEDMPERLDFRFAEADASDAVMVFESIKLNGITVDAKYVNGMGNINKYAVDDTAEVGDSIALRFKDQAVTDAFNTDMPSVEEPIEEIIPEEEVVPEEPPVEEVTPLVETVSLEVTWDEEDGPNRVGLDPATIMGTAAGEKISGVDGQVNVIDGDAGDDRVYGREMNDQILGGDGNDQLYGLAGEDIILGEDGDDKIYGGDGNDYLYGNLGNDKIYAEGGDDVLSGGDGNDFLDGGDGNDTLYGGDGDDTVKGEAGTDLIYGGKGNDDIRGGNGDNTMYGENGDDRLLGGSGVDISYGGSGNDVLAGYEGNDTLIGGSGDDEIYAHEGDDYVEGNNGNDFIKVRDGNDVVRGGSGDDVISAEAGEDYLKGDNGNDQINGGADNDQLFGGGGHDVLIGGLGADCLKGNVGNDVLHGSGLGHVLIDQMIDADPDLIYDKYSNSFYKLVSSPATLSDAKAAAEASVLQGVNGHLVEITTQLEQDFIDQLVLENAVSVWLGGDVSASPTETRAYFIEWDAGGMLDDDAADELYGHAGEDTLYG